ncbi:MAG: PKD domain-containing protein [Candidatus Taylorbacteria bacterium]|nr:PKD domain-containing protein [Candidatus Taylorbacteria bacterium]
MARHLYPRFSLAVGVCFAVPGLVFASVAITEIMYDLPGTDTGREWVEVQNTGSTEISFLKWKLFEANTNHGLTLFQGNATTSASGFAIIADDPTKFLTDNPSYSGTLFKSSFSLLNTGETFELKLDNVSVSQTTYTSGAGGAGDGNSLHFANNAWQPGVPTPGTETANPPPAPPQIPDVPSATTSTTVEEETSSPAPPPPANSGGSTWVYKPQMFVSALVPQKAVAGAPVVFDAAAVGIKKEPLPNARYIWSFGDGGVAEGKKVQHTYHYPATYTVLVDASSGEWSALDKKEITIAAPELVITGIKEGGDGYIEVKNNGQSEVDLSDWLLLAGSGSFRIPRGTLIGAKKAVPFPTAITGLPADSLSTALLYPNGTLVVAYAGKTAVPAPVSLKAEEPKISAISEIQEAPLPKSAPVPGPVPAEVKKKTPSSPVPLPAVAPSPELIGAVGAAEENGMMPWLGGVVLLSIVSVGAYMTMLRPKQESSADALRKEAEMFDIVEDQ